MRNVNSSKEMFALPSSIRFYLTYEECKYVTCCTCAMTKNGFYLTYEECKEIWAIGR